MFFKRTKQENHATPKASLVRVSSFITKDSKFNGDINTNDSIEISGEFTGDIDCKKELIINEFGVVKGNVKADKIITEGKIDGDVICEVFQAEKKSFTTKSVEAKDVVISGTFEGILVCNNLKVEEDGLLKHSSDSTSVVQAKNIEVSGIIEGDIACEVLSTSKDSNIKGKLYVNQLLNDGGTIDGFIGKFKEIVTNEEEGQSDDDDSSSTEHKEEIEAV